MVRDGPAPSLPPFPAEGALPEACDVAIVGGGIVGVSTAWALARRGLSVGLFEKGRLAGEQSSRNWGWVRRTGRDLRELPLMQLSGQLWEGLSAAVGAETGYRRTGIAYAARSEAALERHARWAEAAAEFGVESRILDTAALAALVPALARSAPGALYTAADGRAEPQLATHAIALAARRAGAKLFEGCAVRAVDTAGGRVAGVATERGFVRAPTVVVAGGAWSRLVLAGAGVALPQLKVLSSALRTAPVEADIAPCISLGNVAIRRRLDGGYTVATSSVGTAHIVPDTLRYFASFLPAYRTQWRSLKLRLGRAFLDEALSWRPGRADAPSVFEVVRTLSPAPDRAVIAQVEMDLAAAFPALARVRTAEAWAGMIDTTPDAIPVISPVPGRSGLVVATGFAGHGFGLAPGAGEVLAELIAGERPSVDLSPFTIDRFRRGKLELQQWL